MSGVAAALLVLVALAPIPTEAQDRRIRIGVDARTELLSILQLLGTHTGRLGLLNAFDTPYRRDVLRHFERLRGHAAVACLDSLGARGFSFDAPHHLMTHLSPPPELRLVGELPEEIVARARGGRARIEACLRHVRAFAVESGFVAFFSAHAAVYDSMAAPARAVAAATDYVGQLERYFGQRHAEYSIVLAPLLSGNFGPRVLLADGLHIYGVISPFGVQNGTPVFATEDQLRYLIWHEFGHSFVNPLAESQGAALDSAATLLEPIREAMRRRGYANWSTVVNEHIIRAVTARLEALHFGAERGAAALKREQTAGFAYVDSLAAALLIYEAERQRYPSLAAFYPELAGVFRRLRSHPIAPDSSNRTERGVRPRGSGKRSSTHENTSSGAAEGRRPRFPPRVPRSLYWQFAAFVPVIAR